MTRKMDETGWAVKHLRDLPRLRHEKRQMEAKVARLQDRIRRHDHKITLLQQVGEIYEGQPLKDWGGTHRMEGPLHGKPIHHIGLVGGSRGAHIYPNAHNDGETFGLTISDYSTDPSRRSRFSGTPSGGGGLWLGAHFSYEDALFQAKQWCAHGTYTKER